MKGGVSMNYMPIEMHSNTLIGFYSISGAEDIINEIRTLAEGYYKNEVDLYAAQKFIFKKMIQSHGTEYAYKNEESIKIIVELLFADELRKQQPYIEGQYVEENGRHNVLY